MRFPFEQYVRQQSQSRQPGPHDSGGVQIRRGAGVVRWGHGIPLQPFCYTYIAQIRMPDGRNVNPFGRGAVYFGAPNPPACFEDTLQNGTVEIIVRYIFCPTSYCNTITKTQLAQQCFSGDALRSLQNSTGAAVRPTISHHRMLPGMVLLFLSAVHGISSSVVGIAAALVVSVLPYVPYIQAQSPVLKCYACQDGFYATAMADGTAQKNCYDSAILLGPAQQVDCPDKYQYAPDGQRLLAKQKGYCATWIKERDFGDGLFYVMERGCVYPAGVPDDCLRVNGDRRFLTSNGSVVLARIRWTVQYCADKNYCNNMEFPDLVSKCYSNVYAGGATAALPVTRNFSNTDFARYTTPSFLESNATMPPLQDTVYIQAQVIIAKMKSGDTADLNITRANGQTRHRAASQSVVELILVMMLPVTILQLLAGHRAMR
ncbi:uncharacterized protein LOC129602412 isoform X2 [Paramacrobiotus metropolitanus]|nr:uncharacterized protein LOC129602412 isoform X2 [Paramacrobiotus metropolitanus]XP_055357413.1 uncharacterized protein LOC129602412 isoform X2 [Paramacrobiotus metropolitanus]XP_055357421.1 uncharacterized protein LOC129602412 isoform X2 [Paramacrobiotus metropolitanus]XP_055357427.1 uncharacterized protein LOC129602412 isoform X2 [Paramacrobiotus metropolitanus]XP_055357434.1 uncharacterized protein LOC129602412 isoform X2 [Paramacrobiotus metropolitanus]XP_055357442.1 uncharacterized prot